jgi:CDP-diacylglycerol--glycerol-3-phosphate 3-phosphatidyltransferase
MAHITPNMVTVLSLILMACVGVLLSLDRLWIALPLGIIACIMDIIDGQLAKEFGGITKFGGILDSSIDRYSDFFMFAGFGVRYYFLGRHLWILACASGFLGTVMISYVKARAESDGFGCKVGRLQRPERVSLLGIGTLINCLGFNFGIDSVILFLAVGTHMTALYRLHHVYRQTLLHQDEMQP